MDGRMDEWMAAVTMHKVFNQIPASRRWTVEPCRCVDLPVDGRGWNAVGLAAVGWLVG